MRDAFCCSICGSVAAIYEAWLFITTDASTWDTHFFLNKYVISLSFQYLAEYSTREKREREKRGLWAKRIYAMLGVTLRSQHQKIAKLFKTPLGTSVLVAGWFISTIMMHSPGIQYCNTFCIRARIIVDGRSPGDWNTTRAISQQVGRVLWIPAPRSIMFPVVEQVGFRGKGAREEDTRSWSLDQNSRVIAFDDEANRCKPDSSLSVRVHHSSCVSPRRESTDDFSCICYNLLMTNRVYRKGRAIG